MPNQFGPASTPQLYLENQYRLLQQQASDWERNLQAQGLGEDDYVQAVQDMQGELDGRISSFQAQAQSLQQTQSMMDLGLIEDPDAGMEAMWAAVLPKEVRQAMFPEQPEPSKREPLSPNQLEDVADTVEQFASQIKPTSTRKEYGKRTGWDWVKKDKPIRSQASVMKMYQKWKDFIGYGQGQEGMTPTERRQVDSQWDSWVAEKGDTWKWDISSKYVRAERAGGPLTRAYGSQFRKTPTGPLEATNPLQNSIAKLTPKKKQPTAEELNRNKTRENYELGKSLGYWN